MRRSNLQLQTLGGSPARPSPIWRAMRSPGRCRGCAPFISSCRSDPLPCATTRSETQLHLRAAALLLGSQAHPPVQMMTT